MQSITIGSIQIAHTPDWTGDATLTWEGGGATIPAPLLLELITTTADPSQSATHFLDDMISLRRDFELLRRQAVAYRTTLQQNTDDRLKGLEEKVTQLETEVYRDA